MTIRAVETSRPQDKSGELRRAALAADTAALVTDASGHITSFNSAAERLFERQASRVLGRRCYDIVGGRDVFGNRFCRENCTVMAMGRKDETVHAFELSAAVPLHPEQPLVVSVLPCSGDYSQGSLELLHTFTPIDRESRLARALDRLAAAPGARAHSDLPGPRALPGEPPLTSREREVLAWVAAGRANKEIANELEISLATVRNHIHSILEKLEVHSKLEAVSLAFRQGWVSEPRVGYARTTSLVPRG